MNKVKKDLDNLIGGTPRFNNELKREILSNIQKNNKSIVIAPKKFPSFKVVIIFTLLLICLTTFLFITLLENSPEVFKNAETQNSVILDSHTSSEIQTFTDYKPPLEILNYKYDSMDRGNHEYSLKTLLINPQAYVSENVLRGDVVAYKYEFFDGMQFTVARVVGLPGENVEIIDGQIYINDKKLETFYGKAHRLGLASNDEYNQFLKEQGSFQNIDSMKEIYSLTKGKFELSENEVFLVGDDWFRGMQHTYNISEIHGEVLGYYN